MKYPYGDLSLNFRGLPALRGLRGMRGYTKNGQPITTAQWGDTIVWDVPGHSPGTVYLKQNVNGVPGYNGPISVPTAPITLGPGQPQGIWGNQVYDKDPNQGGTQIEFDSLTILPQTLAPGQIPSQGGVSTISPNVGNPINNPANPPTTTVALLPGSGTMPKGTGNVSNIPTGTIYRFILSMGGGYATGANYNGCSQANSNNCDPRFFNTLMAAIQYALSHGEIPYQVLSTNEPWAIINGSQSIDPNRIYNSDGSLGRGMFSNPLALGALAIVAFLLLRR